MKRIMEVAWKIARKAASLKLSAKTQNTDLNANLLIVRITTYQSVITNLEQVFMRCATPASVVLSVSLVERSKIFQKMLF